jgi:hypothetical protein
MVIFPPLLVENEEFETFFNTIAHVQFTNGLKKQAFIATFTSEKRWWFFELERKKCVWNL